MNIGYSLLLGEYLAASDVTYDDGARWQIVCPACKEPAFKVVRQPGEIHYFSHYKDSDILPSDCELRVRGLSRQAMDACNAQSRGQLLEYFLRVLRGAIDRDPALPGTVQPMRAALKSRRFFFFLDQVFNRAARDSWRSDAGLSDIAADMDGALAKGLAGDSGFSWQTQKRIAVDIFSSLMSQKTGPNLRYLAAHAAIVILASHQASADSTTEKVFNGLGWLIEDRAEKAEQAAAWFLSAEVENPLASGGRVPLVAEIGARLTVNMAATLARLPYAAILRERQEASQ
jgi:hypothetical protein